MCIKSTDTKKTCVDDKFNTLNAINSDIVYLQLLTKLVEKKD